MRTDKTVNGMGVYGGSIPEMSITHTRQTAVLTLGLDCHPLRQHIRGAVTGLSGDGWCLITVFFFKLVSICCECPVLFTLFIVSKDSLGLSLGF